MCLFVLYIFIRNCIFIKNTAVNVASQTTKVAILPKLITDFLINIALSEWRVFV